MKELCTFTHVHVGSSGPPGNALLNSELQNLAFHLE